MIRYEGLRSFYKGMSTKIVQSVFASTLLFMVKEELVKAYAVVTDRRSKILLREMIPYHHNLRRIILSYNKGADLIAYTLLLLILAGSKGKNRHHTVEVSSPLKPWTAFLPMIYENE
ncbi:peroxisomal membrane protein pmp34 [Dorcoceras hygrometricum]|uniref:Peroxisomal membrane protein pmp34 n=1 Tax=Dorcoceras hygrometricum TaxID=472368 RepID=A0A2Z7B9K6_9LAMI|nr:peroxisomal membrane protein pmp34 [Dorcoceras hygrometricum]